VKLFKPDIIHSHSSHNVAFPAYLIAKSNRLPFIYEMRGLWEETSVVKGIFNKNSLRYKYNKFMETYLARNAQKTIVISEALREEMQLRGVLTNKISVVPNGASETFYSKEATNSLRERYQIDRNIVLGYIGSVNVYESLDMLVRAVAEISKKCNNVKGMIVGNGPDLDNLIKLSIKLGIRDRMIFTGAVSPQSIAPYYSLIDIFLITRHIGKEVEVVTPLKPYEAMAACRCLLMSDLPAHFEIVNDGETGFFHRAGDFADLVAKCDFLIKSDCVRQKIGENAKIWILRNRLWKHVTLRYQNHYNELMYSFK